MSKKTLRIALFVIGLVLAVAGVIMQFVLRIRYPMTPILLSIVGLLISLEYDGEKWRTPTRVLQAFAVLVILATPLCWFAFAPHWLITVVNVAAIACNLPLAFIGLQNKSYKGG